MVYVPLTAAEGRGFKPGIRNMKKTSASSTPFADAIALLHSLARPDQLEGMARFGISGEGRLGTSMPDLRKLGRSLGSNHRLAGQLWETGIPDAMILAALVGEPQKLRSDQMDRWVADIRSWDVCDQVCSNLFDRSPLAWEKARLWSARKEEFVKRAGYVLIAALAVHDKSATDASFTRLLPLIRRGALDDRNFVRKAVCWALRQIGKRNERLRKAAIKEAMTLRKSRAAPARWIAAETLRELQDPRTVARLRSRSGYRR